MAGEAPERLDVLAPHLHHPFPWGIRRSAVGPSGPHQEDPRKGVGPARGTEEAVKVKPPRSGLPAGAVDEPMTLWSAAVGDAAAL